MINNIKKIISACIKYFHITSPDSPEDHEKLIDEIITNHITNQQLRDHYERAKDLMVPDYDETEERAMTILGELNTKKIILGNKKAHFILYHLGKKPSKAKEIYLLFQDDASEGLKKVVELGNTITRQAELINWSRRPPDPETIVKGDMHYGVLYQSNKTKSEVELLNPDKKVGRPEKRRQELRKIINRMLKQGEFSVDEPSWPRTEIWKKAVKVDSTLFPDDKIDQKEGVFSKAYNSVRKEMR